MRKSIVLLVATASAIASAAQPPQACLDPALVDGLVFLGRSELRVEVSRGQPAFMRDVKLPAGLVLVGSSIRNIEADAAVVRPTVVAYKTTLPLAKASSAVVTALEEQGWKIEPDPRLQAVVGNAGLSIQWVTLCRNGERRRVSTKQAGGARYVTVDSSITPDRRVCNDLVRGAPSTLQQTLSARQSSLPVFEFPEGNARSQGNSHGSSSTLVTTSLPSSRLIDLLASQLEFQGWRRDATWSGSSSSGATWVKARNGEVSRGTLEVIGLGTGTYGVQFSMTVQ